VLSHYIFHFAYDKTYTQSEALAEFLRNGFTLEPLVDPFLCALPTMLVLAGVTMICITLLTSRSD